MDTTTLLIILIVVLILFGGGWYGRGRWYWKRWRASDGDLQAETHRQACL